MKQEAKNSVSYHIHACSSIFIATKVTITKKWNQSACPSLDEWIVTMWCTAIIELYSVIKKIETKIGKMDGTGKDKGRPLNSEAHLVLSLMCGAYSFYLISKHIYVWVNMHRAWEARKGPWERKHSLRGRKNNSVYGTKPAVANWGWKAV